MRNGGTQHVKHLIRKSLITGETTVKLNKDSSKSFHPYKGVRQEWILSSINIKGEYRLEVKRSKMYDLQMIQFVS